MPAFLLPFCGGMLVAVLLTAALFAFLVGLDLYARDREWTLAEERHDVA